MLVLWWMLVWADPENWEVRGEREAKTPYLETKSSKAWDCLLCKAGIREEMFGALSLGP